MQIGWRQSVLRVKKGNVKVRENETRKEKGKKGRKSRRVRENIKKDREK